MVKQMEQAREVVATWFARNTGTELETQMDAEKMIGQILGIYGKETADTEGVVHGGIKKVDIVPGKDMKVTVTVAPSDRYRHVLMNNDLSGGCNLTLLQPTLQEQSEEEGEGPQLPGLDGEDPEGE